MKKIVVWLLFLLLLLTVTILAYSYRLFVLPDTLVLPFKSAISAGYGGVLYLLRAVYVNKCVNKSWDEDWIPWYYIRPFTSIISGIASYIFLKAGLLVLTSEMEIADSTFGFMAVAFIAGLNVDKFTKKLEDLAKAAWGVEKSNLGKDSDKKD